MEARRGSSVKQKGKRLLTFETWCYRRLREVSWIDHITNEEVYRRAGETRSFPKTIKAIRAKLIGYILNHDSLLSRIIENAIEGENSRGQLLPDYIS